MTASTPATDPGAARSEPDLREEPPTVAVETARADTVTGHADTGTSAADPVETAPAVAVHSPTDTGDADPPRRRRRWRRWAAWTAVAVVVLLVAVLIDGVVVANRIRHVDIALPITRAGSGDTYVVLGSDSRADVPPGTQDGFGTVDEVPGSRADVVLVVHVAPDGSSTTLSVPRDLLVSDSRGYPWRLALTLLAGPQTTVDALCRTLGIATTHLVMIDFAGFAAVVDALGGVTVEVPHPVRDQGSGLDIQGSGRVRLDGVQALALVRSRHPEQLVDGRWVAMDDAAGAAARTHWAGVLFQTLQEAAARAKTNPVLLQRLAWTLSGALTTDSGTGPFDLLSLAQAAGTPVIVPGQAAAQSVLGVTVTPATHAAVAAAGIDGGCVPSS